MMDAKKLSDGATLDELLAAWDRLNGAIDRVVTSLPGQMSAASAELEQARWAMRSVVNRYGYAAANRISP
jgi:hypothetical protein